MFSCINFRDFISGIANEEVTHNYMIRESALACKNSNMIEFGICQSKNFVKLELY
jgi:hypothetical protein